MKRAMSLAVSLLISLQAQSGGAQNLSDEKITEKFKPYKSGCFELLDCSSQKKFFYNKDQCLKRLPPMSTFKLFNALAGLELGVVKDAGHEMKWDGQKRELAAWNQDQTLKTAFENSTVWYFQNIAKAVKAERMSELLKRAHYGNENCKGDITKFWLDSSLKISADEQVDFIKRLCFDELPFSKRSMQIVKEISLIKKNKVAELHGKTGSNRQNGKLTLGWFVGYLIHSGKTYVFACNIEAEDKAWGIEARRITESILEESGLL